MTRAPRAALHRLMPVALLAAAAPVTYYAAGLLHVALELVAGK